VVLGGGLMLADDVFDRVDARVQELLRFGQDGAAGVLARTMHADRSPLEGARAICRCEPRAMSMGADAGWA